MDEIVVGYDGSETAEKATVEAARLANGLGCPLHIVFALPRDWSGSTKGADGVRYQLDAVSHAEQALAALAGKLGAQHGMTNSVVDGDPARALVAEAERLGASMIVIGNRRVDRDSKRS